MTDKASSRDSSQNLLSKICQDFASTKAMKKQNQGQNEKSHQITITVKDGAKEINMNQFK